MFDLIFLFTEFNTSMLLLETDIRHKKLEVTYKYDSFKETLILIFVFLVFITNNNRNIGVATLFTATKASVELIFQNKVPRNPFGILIQILDIYVHKRTIKASIMEKVNYLPLLARNA